MIAGNPDVEQVTAPPRRLGVAGTYQLKLNLINVTRTTDALMDDVAYIDRKDNNVDREG